MAYINVAEWTPDQVTDWLKGLDDSMYKYVHSFTNNEVDGRQLLNIRPYELEQLGMVSIGHQEIVLEAVENLRNFHFNLDKENLQFMALHLATAASSLHRQLAKHCDASKIETQILNDITRTIGTIKPLIGWLDRAPFRGQYQFTEICRNMLRLGLEMATIAQRDRFVELPVEQIRATADKLERLANYIIQDITDPMLLQPASLNLVTLKKRDSELGFSIESNYHGIHRVTDIKYNSPAHNSGKIEDGDEIVQINYQTVVAWQYKTVIFFLHESLPDVLLTLKKRPKHTKVYGQIYMQPYRLPSKKRVMGSRWGENLPSPRAGFLTVPEADFNLLKTEEKTTAIASSDTDSSCSDILTPTDTKTTEKEIRLYYPKPRTMLQRRNTICGDELLGHKCGSGSGVPLWHERKTGAVCDPSSPSLRDKSVSFGFGLEIASRPTTCIGIATSVSAKFGSSDAKGIFTDVKKPKQVSINEQQTDADIEDKSKPGVSKVVRFDARMKYEDHPMDDKYTCNVEDTILETFEPIPFADEEEDEEIDALRNSSEKAKDILEVLDRVSNNNSMPFVEAINIPIIARRGRLDKSHSTPAYDNSGEESDTPPAVEPRKEFLVQTPPIPPPRPRKQKDLLPSAIPPPPPKPPGLMNSLALKTAAVSTDPHNVDSKLSADWNNAIVKQVLSSELCAEANELHTPSKTRTLTLKKKHSLISKRRNINLKVLGTGDIQGHLYRRTKDRRGITFWARLYFVMMDTILYGFRSKESLKASCVIFLPGFTVSLAKEVHSKPYAFKVYHSAKTFYFAAESEDALNQWVDFIRQAVLQPNAVSSTARSPDSPGDINTKDLFSETDSSGAESESMVTKNLCTPSPQGAKDISSTFSSSSKSTITPSSSTKHERRYLGSLRKLTKGSLPFKCSSSAEKKPSSDIPVPTDQYRSYRKVPGGSFGIQIGTNTPGYHHDTTLLHPYNTNSATHSAEQYITQRKLSVSSSSSVVTSSGVGDDGSDYFGPPSSPAPTLDSVSMPLVTHIISIAKASCNNSDISFDNSDHAAIKKIPYNFIHASNPNLVEFDFQTSKTLDYSLPKINPSNSWDAHHNIQGFVTLKDLMLQKQEEEAQEMYNNRVLLGVEKKDERKRNALRRSEEKQQQESNSFQKHCSIEGRGGGGVVSKTQNRSLPKTPDYEISFKPDDEAIKKTRTKEGLKLRDFGYEFISGDEPIGGAGATTSRQNSNTSSSSADHHNYEHSWTGAMKQQFLISHKSKKHSNSSCPSSNASDVGAAVGSGIKKKGKLDAFKSERMFQFNKQSTGSSSGMTMTLPLNKKSSHDISSGTSSSCGIKKSHTYNNDLKVKAANSDKYEAHRKNSAPIFSKLTTFASGSSATATSSGNNNKPSKEKKLLGSPLLHRTIFGNHHNCSPNSGVPHTCTGREYDSEIFSQIIFPKVSSHHSNESSEPKFRNGVSASSSSTNISAPDVAAPPPPTTHDRDPKSTNSASNAATPEYPNMECPPVFEPEIYSLTDSSASLTFLLRRKNSGVASSDEKQ